jgi:hypothetical protein
MSLSMGSKLEFYWHEHVDVARNFRWVFDSSLFSNSMTSR